MTPQRAVEILQDAVDDIDRYVEEPTVDLDEVWQAVQTLAVLAGVERKS